MTRKLLSFAIAFCIAAGAFAQTTLPTSWSFVGTAPTGWTQSGTSTYTGSGNTPPAGKFDNTGDWLQIYFSDAPGPLSYYITGNSFSGGTFTVEESVNGITWTALHTFTAPPASVYTQFTDNPNPNSRYIRFYYTTKVSGNIGVDDINLAAAPAGPAQEINVVLNTTTIPNNGTAVFNGPVSTTTPITLTIENQGTANQLTVLSAVITGANQGDFAVASTPSTINASSSAPLVINFTPSAAGTRNATLTIANDDANENPYVINLYGIGGSYASEPASLPSGFTATNIKSYRYTVSFTPASTAPEGYIVLRKAGSPVTDVPADGTVYTRGDAIGTSKVAYDGTATSLAANDVVANTTYYYAVFAYNGPGQYRNYNPNPLAGTVTSSGNMMGSYYTGMNSQNSNFVTQLHNLINPHTQVYYSNYGPTMIDKFTARDTTNGQMVVTCVYSGEQYIYTLPFDWSVLSREHTYAHSWMPTNPATGMPEYDDQHNLFPTDLNNANIPRSNYPFGEVVNATYTFMGCQLGTDANGNTVFEPRPGQKGDLARALMYMAVSYNGVNGNNWGFPNPISSSIPYGQDQNILRQWHYQDPPDSYEIARNDFLDSLQGNRNPFIDSVQYACYIDFRNMTYISNPSVPCQNTTIGVNETTVDAAMEVFPNPAETIFTVSYNVEGTEETTIRLVDMTGRIAYEKQVTSTGKCITEVNTTGMAKGVYTVELRTGKNFSKQKLVIK